MAEHDDFYQGIYNKIVTFLQYCCTYTLHTYTLTTYTLPTDVISLKSLNRKYFSNGFVTNLQYFLLNFLISALSYKIYQRSTTFLAQNLNISFR